MSIYKDKYQELNIYNSLKYDENYVKETRNIEKVLEGERFF